jgi:sigma-B regulation protein RsbU (phosphoserine phosphatase)
MTTASPPGKTSAIPSADRPVVLLVDDQLIIGEAVRRILAGQEGITFHFCQKGAEALATAAKLQPTVILQDLVMPDADGLELVRGYRQQEATNLTPLIVLSSKEEGTTKAEAFARGANDYIVKLPDPVELVARIRYHSRGYVSLLQRNEAFEALRESQEALAAELAKAAAYVRSILPAPIASAGAPVSIDWRFVPSASLGGDCFDYFWIDDDHLAMYLLDVCGHGVGPALLGVSAMNSLRTRSAGGVDLRDPTAVLLQLNATFPMEKHHNMFFTMWYGVYRRGAHTLSYTGGGHPPALLIPAENGSGAEIRKLECPGPPVGIVMDVSTETLKVEVAPGSSLLLYSDGAIEVWKEPGKLWGLEGLMEFAEDEGLRERDCLDRLLGQVKSMAGGGVLPDDFSLVLARFA